MRLFLIGWTDKNSGLYDVAVKLKEKGHKIVYWASPDIFKEVDVFKFPDTIFHDSFGALEVRPAPEADVSDFLPVSAELAKEFYETEIAVLTMMNKKYERLSVDERKHLYYQLLSYWLGILKRYRPEAIIFQLLPHSVYDFIVYEVAKKLNIKTSIFKVTILDDRVFLIDDYKIYPFLPDTGKNLSGNSRLEDLSGDIRESYLRFKENRKNGQNAHIYVRNMLEANSGGNLIRKKLKIGLNSLRDLSIFKKLYLFFKRQFQMNPKTEYLSVQSPADWNKKFIYVSLNYQPECTTSPQGGVFVDQILMIEALSSVLPAGWMIYVKEHPMQWVRRGWAYFSYRYQGYYQKIVGLKNVKLVPIETDGSELIRNCIAVANVTGSSAFEAVLKLKPALMFGYEWFQNCPGVFRVSGPEDCRRALEVIKNGAVHTEEQIINYLALVDKFSLRGYIYPDRQAYLPVGSKENSENLSGALLSELDKIKNLS